MSEAPAKKFLPEGPNGLANEVSALKERLQQLEDRFDERSRETRPMSERIDQILVEVVATRQDLVDSSRELRGELRDVNRTLRRMNLDVATAVRRAPT